MRERGATASWRVRESSRAKNAHPGYYRLGDQRARARLIHRAITEARFYANLKAGTVACRHRFAPAAERRGVLGVVREASRAAVRG